MRGLGCGRRFSAALTWGGEVWTWGSLGGKLSPRPKLLERLASATVVGIACGADHLAMVTGEQAALQARAEEASIELIRKEAGEREQRNMEERHREDAEIARAAAERERVRREEILNEQRRLKLLGRLAKQRQRMEGLQKQKKKKKKKKGEDDESSDEEDKKNKK